MCIRDRDIFISIEHTMANQGTDKAKQIQLEHMQTRDFSSLFDFSNFAIIRVAGKDSVKFLEKATTSDLGIIPEDDGVSTLLLNEEGLILGHAHLIVEKASFLLIVDPVFNVMEHLKALKEKFFKDADVALTLDSNTSAISLQGPQNVTVLRDLFNVDIVYLRCGSCHYCTYNEIPISLIRVGDVTGEDGTIILLPKDKCQAIVELLLTHPECKKSQRRSIKHHQNGSRNICLLYTSPSPRDQRGSRMPSSA
eukprot:TRINITY_DN2343_c0_g1_i2.p1 TRINITY_DN2343_c0_g1~~TRINITY_DN2343_c0_g1_i2.p1  ORF type:complete len:252 (+),score=72.71 TRINITY_DN2343_c0_g1_i2:63-818(+)